MRRAFIALSAALAFAACGQESVALQGPLVFEKSVDYTAFQPIEGCKGERAKPVYFKCLDARELYDAAVSRAAEEGRPLMIVWGFDECPSCMKLEKTELSGRNAWTVDRFLKEALTPIQRKAALASQDEYRILTLKIDVRRPSGAALAEEIGVTGMAQERGRDRVRTPFITLTNAETGVLVSQAELGQGFRPCTRGDEFVLDLVEAGFLPDDPSRDRRQC
ncbi:thioredoxin family protein [Hyphomonas sp.]|uniref:thioredoxin family protein n=1 Tax=Hyphomonas sp. TaxID=87 RepID=UPI0035283E5E